jgi:hypothetical protein
MYGWIFRHLPGPIWVRIFTSAVLVAAALCALVTWVFPWMAQFTPFAGTTLDSQ